MSKEVLQQLDHVLRKIDRPGTFCASGSVPFVLPGLEVENLGAIGFPLTVRQAKELKKQCEQAPYGKGEQTLVDTKVRRVWRLTPDHFALTNPEWQSVLQQMVQKVQEELGLQEQKLESHLYDLLLYEKGSFFLPHRDGEKLDRMVATLVVVLPSSFEGGELVVRHEGQEKTIDFRSDNVFRLQFAAFYADCEHEIRPLRAGYRLALVYNLTLKKGKKSLAAPRIHEHVETLRSILAAWAEEEQAHRLAVTLEHQYTKDGLTWDALKGADRARAQVLQEAAQEAGCRAYLALLTFHESGSAEHTGGGGGYYGRRRRWGYDEDEDASQYEMGEIYDTELTADHWSDPQGNRLPIEEIGIDESELLDPEALQNVDPEVEFEGYTGNAGMTLDRWYRQAAIFLWPNKKHFDILCDAGSHRAVEVLTGMVKSSQNASAPEAATLRSQGIEFARAILTRWRENPHGGYARATEPDALLQSLQTLDDRGLIQSYLTQVLARDASVDPGPLLLEVCTKVGWAVFQPELEIVFKATTGNTFERNLRLLEQFCLTKPRKKQGWSELCRTLAQALLQALEAIDQAKPDFRTKQIDHAEALLGLTRSLIAGDQFDLLAQFVAHVLAAPAKYPLLPMQFTALTTLQPWLTKNVKKPCPALANWIAACCTQLEARTDKLPQPPSDYRRPVTVSCNCKDCAELKRFLADPRESTHRFHVVLSQRKHLASVVEKDHCDVDCSTDRSQSPHVLVGVKNTASYQARLKTYHEDRERLATLRALQASLPK